MAHQYFGSNGQRLEFYRSGMHCYQRTRGTDYGAEGEVIALSVKAMTPTEQQRAIRENVQAGVMVVSVLGSKF